ncbi:MAG: ABC transporter permease [Candidatus Dormibacteria bacterium]|jgi:ABC-2 type transport system permease protein
MSTAAATRDLGRPRSAWRRASLIGHQFRFDLLSFTRNSQARFATVIMPILFLVIFIALFGNGRVPLGDGVTVKTSTYYIPGLTAFGIISAAYASLVVSVVRQRESGILKRRRATPVPAFVPIAGRALVAVVAALLMCALLLGIGAVFYNSPLPTHTIPGVAISAAVGAVSFCCVAFGVASFVRSADAAQPMVQLTLLPLSFISGIFVPLNNVPGWLGAVAGFFPARPLADALRGCFDPATTGAGINGGDLLVLGAWAAGGLLVALLRFSWVPRGQ